MKKNKRKTTRKKIKSKRKIKRQNESADLQKIISHKFRTISKAFEDFRKKK